MKQRQICKFSRNDCGKWIPEQLTVTEWLMRKAQVALDSQQDVEFEITSTVKVLLRYEEARYASVGRVDHYTVLLLELDETPRDWNVRYQLLFDPSERWAALEAFARIGILGTSPALFQERFEGSTDVETLASNQKRTK